MHSKLRTIRVLFRTPESLDLYGIPYIPQGSPRDLYCRRRRDGNMEIVGPKSDWIWLGTPGWFGNYNEKQIGEIKAFLKLHHDTIPGNPYEWAVLPPIEVIEQAAAIPAVLAPKPISKGQRYIARCNACDVSTSALANVFDRQEIQRNRPAPGVVYMHPRTGDFVLNCRSCGEARIARLVRGKYSKKIACTAKCMESTGFVCECSCAGRNHGGAYQE